MKAASLAILSILMAQVIAAPALAASKPLDRSTPVRYLQGLNALMQACWIKSKDPAFRQYRVIPELDTKKGKPRLLIVKARAAQGLPQLVIEAEGSPARLSSYGPLAKDKLIERMQADVIRWSNGDRTC